MEQLTRVSLIERLRRPDDRAAWEEFWTLYQPLLRMYVARFHLKPQDAEDLVQELYPRLLEAMKEFQLDHSRGQFRGWLRRFTDSRVQDFLRARQRRLRHEQPAEYLSQVMDSFDASAERECVRQTQWRKAVLDRAVECARQEFKGRAQTWNCFELSSIQRLPAKEIAARLGIQSVNNVYVYAHRVLQRVRELCTLFGEELSGDEERPCSADSSA